MKSIGRWIRRLAALAATGMIVCGAWNVNPWFGLMAAGVLVLLAMGDEST